MADEFMKGFALSMIGALGVFFFGGWYRTPSFEQTTQLIAEPSEPNNVYDAIAIFGSDVFLYLMILGPLTFWVLVPTAHALVDGREAEA